MIIEIIFGIGFATDILQLNEYTPPHEVHTIREVKKPQPLHELKKTIVKNNYASPFKHHLKPKNNLKVSFKNTEMKEKGILSTERVNIYFDFDSYKVKEKEKVKILNIKSKKVHLKGMASPEGTKEYNYKLSQKRAEAVKNILGNKRVIEIKAVGEDECREKKESYFKCRRVEIRGEN